MGRESIHVRTLNKKVDLLSRTGDTISTFYKDVEKTKLMTVPDVASDTLALVGATQTLTGKTLTTPKISDGDLGCTITSANQTNAAAVVTIPDCGDAADDFVLKDTAQTLTLKTLTLPKIVTTGGIVDAGGDKYVQFIEATTPKTFISVTTGDTTVAPLVRGAGETNTGLLLAGTGTGKVKIGDGADTTKLLTVELVGATTGKTLTLTSSHSDDRTVTFPNATDTLVGKATSDVLTNKTLDSAGTGNYLKNIVLAYAGSITRAEMITGKTLVAGVTAQQIKVLSVKAGVVGAFDGGAGTSFILQDTNGTPVVILTALKAALTNGAKISTEGLAIANVAEGAGMTAALTSAKGIAVAADAAWNAGTNIDIVIKYMYV